MCRKRCVRDLLAIAAREADEIERRFPKVQRRVGGYNLDALVPGAQRHQSRASAGRLRRHAGLFHQGRTETVRRCSAARAVGACHFGSFHEAMDGGAAHRQAGPIAVELIDRTMLGLARDIAMFKPTIDAFLRGDPDAILFVEFAEDDEARIWRRLKRLGELMGDLGLSLGQQRRQVGRRGRGARSETAGRHHRGAHGRSQHHDVDEGGG